MVGWLKIYISHLATTLLPCSLVGFNCHKLAPQGYKGKYMAHKLAPQAYAAKIKLMVFSMNGNVINENIETEGVLVHQKFCCVLAEGAALETLWEMAWPQAEPCSSTSTARTAL